MTEPGGWFVFFIYVLPMFFAQWGFFRLLEKRISFNKAVTISSIVGLILGTSLVIFMFLMVRPLLQG
jgi:hypothetical protein